MSTALLYFGFHGVRSRLYLCRGDTDGREGDTDDGVSEDDYTFAK